MKRGFIILVMVLFLISCSQDENSQETVDIKNLSVPGDFDYSLDQDVELRIELTNRTWEGIEGITYSLYYAPADLEDYDDVSELHFLKKVTSDIDGMINTNLILPSYADKLIAIGFMQQLELEINNGIASYVFNNPDSPLPAFATSDWQEPEPGRGYSYLDGFTFNNQGVPAPMDTLEISADLLTRIDTSLPEREDLAVTHPQYLQDNVTTNLIIEEASNVWLTFVTEGAGLYNTLGFYTYPVGQAPANQEELEHVIVFPNASLAGSGGGLQPGDRVYLGAFEGGTEMGWFLIANGWINYDDVDTTKTAFYSNREYNPEGEDYNQHQVLLYDNEENLFLMGFEDLTRPWGDNDFNDAVFFIEADPIENINLENVLPIDEPVDSDNDGVHDPYDDYPDMPDRAYNVYYPAEDLTATLVFEDKWPNYGDYDMNDKVIDYQYMMVTNAEYEVVELKMDFSLRAEGAFYENGFSVLLPFELNNLSIIDSSENIIPGFVADGEFTIIDLYQYTGELTGLSDGVYYNTEQDYPYYAPVDFSLTLALNTPVSEDELAFSFPFNPFLRVQGHNDQEVHLMNYAATGRHDSDLFQTGDDDSNPDSGRYFVSPLNLPWALNLPESWQYPTEKTSITEAYLNFAAWAESGGESYQDWYLYNENNVDETKIYQTP